MPWNPTWPVGTASVKANKATGQQNITYIETTMGNSIVGTNTVTTRDHFWDVGANEDGRHRFVQSPAFTVASSPADPVIGTGMDGVNYLKLTKGQVQNFYRSAHVIYQTSPNVLFGTVVLSSSLGNVVAVPAGCYGEIFMYTDFGNIRFLQKGIFSTDGTTCFPVGLKNGTSSTQLSDNVTFQSLGNSLFIRALGIPATWTYFVTYRAL